MRGLRTTLAAAWILGLAPAITLAGANATVEQLLAYRPTQKGVDYEVPTTPAAIAACKVETVANAKGAPIGYALRDGQGKVLCRFVDNDKLPGMDQWSYYQDGFEIYREVDLNGDQKADVWKYYVTAQEGSTQVSVLVCKEVDLNHDGRKDMWVFYDKGGDRVRDACGRRASAERKNAGPSPPAVPAPETQEPRTVPARLRVPVAAVNGRARLRPRTSAPGALDRRHDRILCQRRRLGAGRVQL